MEGGEYEREAANLKEDGAWQPFVRVEDDDERACYDEKDPHGGDNEKHDVFQAASCEFVHCRLVILYFREGRKQDSADGVVDQMHAESGQMPSFSIEGQCVQGEEFSHN